MLPDKDIGCHHTGFTRKCRELVASGECNRWLQIQGQNPNTGEKVNQYNCIDNWTPMLLIENSQMQRQTGAAVESFRNEVIQRSQPQYIGIDTHNMKLIEG
jgi:hypothetical protein